MLHGIICININTSSIKVGIKRITTITMNKIIIIIFNILLLFLRTTLTNAINNNATLTLTSNNPISKCLDGTPHGFYHRPATSKNATDKWIFMLEGGGLCSHEEDCVERSKTSLGSSNYFPKQFDYDSIGSIFTNDPSNPFFQWNYVYLPYCDGGMWSGTRTTKSNETFGLYFSGHNNIEATVDYLSVHAGLNVSNNFVIFSGGSAGGVGAFLNYEYVQERLPSVKLVGAPVGGFPPALNWYTGKNSNVPEEDVRDSNFPYLTKLFDAYLPTNCRENIKGGEQNNWKCFVPRLAYPYYELPLFIMEAITDVVIMGGFEGMDHKIPRAFLNPDVWKWIKEYGVNATNNFKEINTKRDGLFAPSCLIHCQFGLDKPIINGINVATAMYNWVIQYMPSKSSGSSSITSLSRLNDKDLFVDDMKGDTDGDHVYMDKCKSGSYYPPCGICPKL